MSIQGEIVREGSMLKIVLSAAIVAAAVTYGYANAQEGTPRGEELRSWSVKINDARRRFEVLSAFHGKAVLDRETQLVWQQSPAVDFRPLAISSGFCNTLNVDNRLGWRMPTVQELATLVDPSVHPGPTLPPGHPFSNVQGDSAYWSSTTGATNPELQYIVSFQLGEVSVTSNVPSEPGGLPVWCVRGGLGSGVPSSQ
jgi:hypothetical protein